MSERAESLARRRSALREHCAVQRNELAQAVHDVEARLGSVDRGINAVRHLATKPAVLIGGAAMLAFLGPRRLFRWVGRGAVFLTAGRRVMRLIR